MSICLTCEYENRTGVTVDDSKTNVAWGIEIGVSEGAIRRHRIHRDRIHRDRNASNQNPLSRTAESSDGSFGATITHTKQFTLKDAEEWVRRAGKDPADYVLTVDSRAYGNGMWSNGVRAKPLAAPGLSKLDADELIEFIGAFDPRPAPRVTEGFTRIVGLSDLQIGKVDVEGGTESTIAVVLEAVDVITSEGPYKQVVVVDGGDLIENFCNTRQQAQTNDRTLTEQIRVARRLMLQVLLALSEVAEEVVYVSVPSNHGQVRTGIGRDSAASTPADDFGLEVSYQLEDAFELSGATSNITFVRPDGDFAESLALEAQDGTVLGVVHGHQFGNATLASKWWASQDHGRGPTSNAHILLHGHHHNFCVSQSGNARWIVGLPTADPGSSWFSEKTGQTSQRGVLVMDVYQGSWQGFRIL